MKSIVDVQGQSDSRNEDINKVGVKGVAVRAFLNYGNNKIFFQGLANCYVFLPSDKKGTHMSRMARSIAGLMDKNLTYDFLKEAASDLYEKLETNDLSLELTGEIIREKISPVSKFTGYESLKLTFVIKKQESDFTIDIILEVIGTSLCPASKTNSKYGAHNQRSLVKVKAPFTQDTNISAYINTMEGSLSAQVFPILKLDDEALVTETAYENPKFVEDIVRDVAKNLKEKNLRFKLIDCENFESIHTHNAYALILNQDE